MIYPYSGPNLIQQLHKQQSERGKAGLFKHGTFSISWRAKAGSSPHPDGETLVPAGDPCGAWQPASVIQNRGRRSQEREVYSYPEDLRVIDENLQAFAVLPLHGYIPASSIRGIVRQWIHGLAENDPALQTRADDLLGYQNRDSISPGKIEFLDAWPKQPTCLSLDVVNPQSDFQIFHDGNNSPSPHTCYSLGDGGQPVEVTVAIRGVPGEASSTDVATVWEWLKHALDSYGVGGRVASGYGAIEIPNFAPKDDWKAAPHQVTTSIQFTLHSQGNSGPDMMSPELRPTHWRGWLRGWLMRFFLGVMSRQNAIYTVSELMGTLEESETGNSLSGKIRTKLFIENFQANESLPRFYTWKGEFEITSTQQLWNQILQPIISFAAMVGGVGKGCRRPLHIFHDLKGRARARGCHVLLKYSRGSFGVQPKLDSWNNRYSAWQRNVATMWPDRYQVQAVSINAEVFSPAHCSVYVMQGPPEEPVDVNYSDWSTDRYERTRGEGMDLIYEPSYKRKPDVGGNAAGGGDSHCSWVSIKRAPYNAKAPEEIVCLFLGQRNSRRQDFLQALKSNPRARHIFGRTSHT